MHLLQAVRLSKNALVAAQGVLVIGRDDLTPEDRARLDDAGLELHLRDEGLAEPVGS